jgi:hypothetical protein
MAFLLLCDAGKKGIADVPFFQAGGILSANASGGKNFDKDLAGGRTIFTSP